MKICECNGDITGDHGPYYHSSEVVFPFNVNWPQRIDLNSLRGKKIKLTIEIVEDDRQS